MGKKRSCSKRTPVARVSDPRGHGPQARAAQDPAAPRDVVSVIRGAELEIVNAIIGKAKEGSYQHAKFLFDYAGLSPQAAPEQDEPSLAKVLLERLGLDQESWQDQENSDNTGNPPQI